MDRYIFKDMTNDDEVSWRSSQADARQAPEAHTRFRAEVGRNEAMPHFVSDLLALHQAQDWLKAAKELDVSEKQLRTSIACAEAEHGQRLVHPGTGFCGVTPAGKQILDWAQQFTRSAEDLKQAFAFARRREAVLPLIERRSTSPKRMEGPGPSSEEVDLMIQAALSAPDHGGLHPWRLLVFSEAHRPALAELFKQEKVRRDPLASSADIERAGEHATRSPTLLAFVISLQERRSVPLREQWLAAGAALGNFLNAAHQLGFGAIMLSGDRCFDPELKESLGIGSHEFLAGFVSMGRATAPAPPRKPIDPRSKRSLWTPCALGADAAHGSTAARAPLRENR